ncbi:MAG TPA: minor capsid protein [Aggregatilineales bacterium]|nr:minor capsid protein [Aggregatilineales bacterium]
MAPRIETPRGHIEVTKGGKAELVWHTQRFAGVWQKRYTRAQMFVDSEILRLSEPFTPLQTGMLIKSGQLGTEIGSGKVQWIAPYAKRQYYHPRKPGSETGPLRGPYWFERMKKAHGQSIVRGAKKIAGRGSRP